MLRVQSAQIHIATMTPGDGGSTELPPQEIARLRMTEAAAAAALLNGQHHCVGAKDLLICYDPPSIRRVTEIVRTVKPTIVFTHSPQDYLLDHEVTSQLVRAACFNASVRNVATGAPNPAPATERIPHLYYTDAMEGKDAFGAPVVPGFYVNITDSMPMKEAMLACHESQREWLSRQHGLDQYLQSMRDWAAACGSECGVEYAEAFRQHLGHAHPQNNVLEELIGIRKRS